MFEPGSYDLAVEFARWLSAVTGKSATVFKRDSNDYTTLDNSMLDTTPITISEALDLNLVQVGWSGHIVFVEADGKKTLVQNSARYSDGAAEKGKKALRAKLNDLRRRYKDHHKRTGKRFEVEQKAKDRADREAQVRLQNAALEHFTIRLTISGAGEIGRTLRRWEVSNTGTYGGPKALQGSCCRFA